jgi:hypothetical protein
MDARCTVVTSPPLHLEISRESVTSQPDVIRQSKSFINSLKNGDCATEVTDSGTSGHVVAVPEIYVTDPEDDVTTIALLSDIDEEDDEVEPITPPAVKSRVSHFPIIKYVDESEEGEDEEEEKEEEEKGEKHCLLKSQSASETGSPPDGDRKEDDQDSNDENEKVADRSYINEADDEDEEDDVTNLTSVVNDVRKLNSEEEEENSEDEVFEVVSERPVRLESCDEAGQQNTSRTRTFKGVLHNLRRGSRDFALGMAATCSAVVRRGSRTSTGSGSGASTLSSAALSSAGCRWGRRKSSIFSNVLKKVSFLRRDSAAANNNADGDPHAAATFSFGDCSHSSDSEELEGPGVDRIGDAGESAA